jgi:hypothetical protein
MIADHLYITNSRRTMGCLKLVCKTLQSEVAPLFWRRIVCDNSWGLDWSKNDDANGQRLIKPLNELPLDKWQHTR